MTERPSARETADRALVLYALVRRAAIEVILTDGDEPLRRRQAENARQETEHWLERESLLQALSPVERTLFDAPTAAWTPEAIADGLWRKEALGVLLWALKLVERMPAIDVEFEVAALNAAIEGAGSVSSFRAAARLRDPSEIEAAWREADTWFGATEGAIGEDSTLASISAERSRALAWLRHANAPTP
ncbi:MAG: DUF4272 domain-containing protein [Actinomycetota bacterium]